VAAARSIIQVGEADGRAQTSTRTGACSMYGWTRNWAAISFFTTQSRTMTKCHGWRFRRLGAYMAASSRDSIWSGLTGSAVKRRTVRRLRKRSSVSGLMVRPPCRSVGAGDGADGWPARRVTPGDADMIYVLYQDTLK